MNSVLRPFHWLLLRLHAHWRPSQEYVVVGFLTHMTTMLLLAAVALYHGFALNQVQMMAIVGVVGTLLSFFFFLSGRLREHFKDDLRSLGVWRAGTAQLLDYLNTIERDVVPQLEDFEGGRRKVQYARQQLKELQGKADSALARGKKRCGQQ